MDKRQGPFDLTAVGELLIDFTPLAGTAEGRAFQQNAGGAPGNVLVMAARLGQHCANAAGALCTQRRGAIPAMPSAEEIRALCALG